MSLVTGRPLTKGMVSRIKHGALQSVYAFQFNPTEFKRAHSVDYVMNSSPGSPLPLALFKSVKGDKITFQLMLDSLQDFQAGTNTRPLRSSRGNLPQQAEIESWGQPDLERFVDAGALGSFIGPQLLRLTMGTRNFSVRLIDATFNDIMFDRALAPVRTVVDITMEAVFVDTASLQARLSELSSLRGLAVTLLNENV